MSDWYISNINNHYVRPIDFGYQRGLQSDLAGRLYEILGMKFYGAMKHRRRYVRIDYHDLCQLLPMTPQDYATRARQILRNAHKELSETGYLTRIDWEQPAKGAWHIRYYPGERAKAEFMRVTDERAINNRPEEDRNAICISESHATFDAGAASEDASAGMTLPRIPDHGLCKALTMRGISASIAQKLVMHYPDRIIEKVDIFDWIQEHRPETIKNPAGYLRRMIEEDRQAPEGYRSRMDRETAVRQSEKRQQVVDRKVWEQQWKDWQAKRPEEKILGELFIWESRFKHRHGRRPAGSEREAKQRELLAALPEIEARYRADIFGRQG